MNLANVCSCPSPNGLVPSLLMLVGTLLDQEQGTIQSVVIPELTPGYIWNPFPQNSFNIVHWNQLF